MRRAQGVSAVLLLVAGCGSTPEPVTPKQPAPKASAPVAPSKPAEAEPVRVLPQLRTGELAPDVQAEPIVGSVVGYHKSATHETFEVEFALENRDSGFEWVTFEGSPFPGPLSFVDMDWGQTVPKLWLRRSIDKNSKPLTRLEATISQVSGWNRESAAHQFRVLVAELPKLKSDPKLPQRYNAALVSELRGTPMAAFLDADVGANASNFDDVRWSDLMRMMSGYDSVEAALRAKDGLRVTEPKLSTIAITDIKGPELPPHPWKKMLERVPAATSATEPLAAAVPADFYYVRAQSYDALQAMIDEADTWITPAAHLSEGGQRYDLVERYRKQIGLTQSELTRVLGPSLIRDLALVGSDPFLRQGSDVTLVIRPKDPIALANALQAKLRIDFPAGVNQVSSTLAGVELVERTTADGVLHQFVVQLPKDASRDAITLVSNSRGALTRILEVVQGKRPSLGSEPDFEYMLRRDPAVPSDVLAYAGDRFVSTSVSPAQRILDARRQLALGELRRAGYAAMLFALMEGRQPASVAELQKSPWLKQNLLSHSNKEPIKFELGAAPRSSWGTPAALTPLADLPALTHVSAQERDAYTSFSQSYQAAWNDRIDPIAGRFRVVREGNKRSLQGHVRVLPIANNRDYQEVWSMAGSGQASTQPNMPGVFFTVGIGDDARLRSEFSAQSRGLFGRRLSLDWLGSWATIGMGDEPIISQLIQEQGLAPEVPSERERRGDFEDAIKDLPAFAVIDIKNAGMAAIMITALRRMAEGSASDLLRWEKYDQYRDTSVTRVSFAEVELYYSLTKTRLYMSLQEGILHKLIDADLDGKPLATAVAGAGASQDRGRGAASSTKPSKPVDPTAGQGAGQGVFDFRMRNPSGLLQAFSWAVETELRRETFKNAHTVEVILRGLSNLPEAEQQRIMTNYFGSRTVTPEGAAFKLTPKGVEDPIRGTAFHPKYADVPAPGSSLKAMLDALGNAHALVAFDKEPGAPEERSLRAEFTIVRDAPAP